MARRLSELYVVETKPRPAPERIYVMFDDKYNEPYVNGPLSKDEILERYYSHDEDAAEAEEELFGEDGSGVHEGKDGTLYIVDEGFAQQKAQKWTEIATAIKSGQKLPKGS